VVDDAFLSTSISSKHKINVKVIVILIDDFACPHVQVIVILIDHFACSHVQVIVILILQMILPVHSPHVNMKKCYLNAVCNCR
jgi:hypothetical protein